MLTRKSNYTLFHNYNGHKVSHYKYRYYMCISGPSVSFLQSDAPSNFTLIYTNLISHPVLLILTGTVVGTLPCMLSLHSAKTTPTGINEVSCAVCVCVLCTFLLPNEQAVNEVHQPGVALVVAQSSKPHLPVQPGLVGGCSMRVYNVYVM